MGEGVSGHGKPKRAGGWRARQQLRGGWLEEDGAEVREVTVISRKGLESAPLGSHEQRNESQKLRGDGRGTAGSTDGFRSYRPRTDTVKRARIVLVLCGRTLHRPARRAAVRSALHQQPTAAVDERWVVNLLLENKKT